MGVCREDFADRMSADDRQHFAALALSVAERRDQRAFAQLFDFFAPRLKAYLMRLGLDASAAEDLVQEVMTVLWHKAHLYDPAKSSLSTWLFRIARNRRIDLVRRDRSDRLDPADPLLIPSDPPAPDATVEAEDRERIVHTALESLPGEQVELVRMAFFLGRAHAEIAEATGLPLGTVKSRIRLAFGKLKKLLEET